MRNTEKALKGLALDSVTFISHENIEWPQCFSEDRKIFFYFSFFLSFFCFFVYLNMTEAAQQLNFEGHAMAGIDTFRNTFLIDSKRDTTTIADHINYQLSQYNNTVTAPPDSAITTFINNHAANNSDLIDRSNQNQVEHVLEWAPNKRYCRLNTLLGKGAFKVVHKAMDREEGYEVAWNVLHVRIQYL